MATKTVTMLKHDYSEVQLIRLTLQQTNRCLN